MEYNKLSASSIYKSVIYMILLFLIPIDSVFAGKGYEKLIHDVFPKGTMSNTTASAIVREQSAGHYIGGSSIIKAPADPPLQLVQARAPSCRVGGLPCAAQIELLGGAISLVSGDELVRYLKKLPQTAATYGAMMAIKTLCPQCQDLLEWLDSKADWLNKFSLDQCEMVQSLMGPIDTSSECFKSTALKQSNMVLSGSKKDMAQIQQESKDGEVGKLDEELESQLGENYNLVWKAFAKRVVKSSDGSEFKELLMSISGTIIGTKENGKPSIRHLKSLVNKDLIREFIGLDGINNSKVKLYKCDELDHCLKPVPENKDIHQGAFLYSRVKEILKGLIIKIQSDNITYDPSEEMLIALSSDQLIAKIELDLAIFSDVDSILANQISYLETLCFDVVTNYFQELLANIQEVVSEYAHSQIADKDKFNAFAKETRETMRMLEGARKEAREKYELIQQSKMRLRSEKAHYDKEVEKYFTKPK